MMLPEEKYRREKFSLEDSRPVKLSDGQTWFFPKPSLGLRCRFENGKVVGHDRFLTNGREVDELLKASQAIDPNDLATQIGVMLAISGLMLKQNYDLADDELGNLLIFDQSPESVSMLEAITTIAGGGFI